MPDTKANLLIVDDEPSIRTTLSCLLEEMGFRVRTAEDGLSALIEIGEEIPDILLSDLHMPGMSGFELLTVVRCRFPALRTIAMSGAFSGDEVPSGVAADGFYQKGSGVGLLLKMMETQRQRVQDTFATAQDSDQGMLQTFQPGMAGAPPAPSAMQTINCRGREREFELCAPLLKRT
ncbi:MAG: response regulator [Terracidiphilus sp.]